VVVDSRLEIDPRARVLQAPGRCLVYSVSNDAHRLQALQALPDVEVCTLPPARSAASDPGAAAKNDLAALLEDLGRRGINELHVEAGEKLNGSWLRAGLVDELLVYLAPSLLGSGRRLAEVFATPLESLDARLDLRFVESTRVGPDLRVRALTAQGQEAWARAWAHTSVAAAQGACEPCTAGAPEYPG
jgi:diaminohydroxyphosphoribosylaminopyrimidine deaminase/5-amino-6-(5-phosphoribosylamino)uracil reductase